MKSNKITIIDSTLREGEQTPGVFFTSEQKVEVIERLIACNIIDFEIGLVGISKTEDQILKRLNDRYKSSCNVYISCLLREKDINIIHSLNPSHWFLITPVSEILIQSKLGCGISSYLVYLNKMIKIIEKFNLCKPFIVLEDSSNADYNVLCQIIEVFIKSHHNNFIYSDTIGKDNLNSSRFNLSHLKNNFPKITLGVHFHNDFGLALANSLTAIELGINYISASINGIGERAGICDLLHLVVQVENCNYNIKKIIELSIELRDKKKIVIPDNYPIIGRNNYLCGTGTHIAAIIKDDRSYAPSKDFLNKKVEFLLGKHSGKEVLTYFSRLNNVDIQVDDRLLSKFKLYINTSYSTFEKSNEAFLHFVKLFIK